MRLYLVERFYVLFSSRLRLGTGPFRGETRGNAVPIVKVFKNALWTALRTSVRPRAKML